MKTIARTGAVLSFGFFTVPGLALMAHAHGDSEWGEIIFGSLFIGIGCFAGTLLWLLPSLPARNPQPTKTTHNNEKTPAER